MSRRHRCESSVSNQRGQALVFVAFATVALTVLSMLGASHFNSSISNSSSFINEKKTFYISQGLINISTYELEQYVSENPGANGASMTSYLQGKVYPLVPTGYTVPVLQATIVSSQPDAVIPNGPFAGMQAPLNTVQLQISVKSTATNVQSNLNVILTIGDVFPFQFIFFGDYPVVDWYPSGNFTYNGRVHINGDVCPANFSGNMDFDIITSAGRLMSGDDTRCVYPRGIGGAVQIATDPNFTTFASITNTTDNGCINCGGTGLAWPAYSYANGAEMQKTPLMA